MSMLMLNGSSKQKGSQVPTKLSVGAEVKVMALSTAGTDKKDKENSPLQ